MMSASNQRKWGADGTSRQVGRLMGTARTFEYQGSARTFAWYDLGEDGTFVCRCGWHGTFMASAREHYETLVDGSCPVCDTMLVIRSYPTRPEIVVAAADGNADATRQLRSIERAESEGTTRSA